MSSYLGYSYSTRLTEKEQIEINEKTKKCREEFSTGFVKGARFSLAAYSLYLLTTSAAYAADSNVPPTTPKTPGFKPLSEGTAGGFVGGFSAICGDALQSGDFYLGLACALLLVVGGIGINRP